nr:uncharacterized protein LOC106679400 isoform X2 [Halyomorpha halys]
MDSYFQEAEVSSCRSSESDDSQRLVIVEDSGDPDVSEASSGSVQDDTVGRRFTYEEYKKICFRDFLLKELTYFKLKRLMTLYHTEISEKITLYHRRCLASWKSAKEMSKTLIMFHYMYEDINENIIMNSIYYNRMSDLLSIYIDFEIKASHRVVRGLPSTKHSEISFVRAMLVFKLWIQISKDADEREKILKLASHLAKPPEELIKEPSKLAKDILPCNFHKCFMDLTTYIVGTPLPLRRKIKTFLERTRVIDKYPPKESLSESNDTMQEQITEEKADVKALEEIQSGLQKIIILENKNKQFIKSLKNKHYKYAPFEELSERVPFSFECLRLSKKDASNQTIPEQNEEFPRSHSKMYECMDELVKHLDEIRNMKPVQNQEIDFTPADKEKTITSVSDPNANIQNNDGAAVEVIRIDKKKRSKENMEDDKVSAISVRPTASISNRVENVSSKDIAEWHIPMGHCQSKVNPCNPFVSTYRLQMASGLTNEGSAGINQTDPELPSMTPTLSSGEETLSSINDEQHNPYADLVRSTNCLLEANSSLPPPLSNRHSEPSVTNSSPSTLFNRQAILRSSYVNDTIPDCREDNLFVRDTTIKYYPPMSKNNSNQVHNMNSKEYLKHRNFPMQQPYPMIINQYNSRPHYSQANNSFSFYDDDTIAKSGPRVMRAQSGCPNIGDCNSLMPNSVRSKHPLPFYLSSGNIAEPTPRANQTRRGRGCRNTSLAQHSYRKQSPDTPANIPINTNSISNYQTVQNWPNVSNLSSQVVSGPPVPIPNIVQNDPNLTNIRLPPYSSIRRKNNGFDQALSITDSSSSNLPANTTPNCFPSTNTPIAVVTSSQNFSPVSNNSFSSPVINSSLLSTNILHYGPVTSASTSCSVLRTSETNSEDMGWNNYTTNEKDPIFMPLESYYLYIFSALDKPIDMLTHQNDIGFSEYNFEKMPIPLEPFKDTLASVEKANYTTGTIDRIVALLSQTNKNFVNKKNMVPPQLLKVNNTDINMGKFNISQEKRKKHEVTLYNDYLAFVYQEKVRNFCLEPNDLSNDLMTKTYPITRCYCLQCSINRMVLDINYVILRSFRLYQICHSSVHHKENEKNRPSKVAVISKRSLDKSIEERDSPLPLKKRVTSTPPNESRSINDSEVSYPSTPMISIAELELLKDIPTNMIEHKTDSANVSISGTSSTIPNSITENEPSETSKNIFTNNPVPEVATYRILESSESKIILTSKNYNSLPRKPSIKSSSKKSAGRPRKNVKKDS